VQEIIFGITGSFAAIRILQWHHRWPVLNRKPFNCDVCLSGWLALVACFLPDIVLLPMTAFFTASFITALLNKYVWKFLG
jgi:hypothetical protein